jgi:sec-independent protein translocase protein TatB
MSGVGFWELIILTLIGLIVLGPEKLPRVANQLGGWLGQARRMTRVMKRQLEDEIDVEKELGLKTPPKSKPDVSKPKYVHEANIERPDDFSPEHDANSIGSGVGDDQDYIDDDELEPLATNDSNEGAEDALDAATPEDEKNPTA